jgi:hypothetical protein
MRRNDLQIQPRHLPQEAEPDQQPEIPAQENELEERNADERIPVAGQRQLQPAVLDCAVPRCGAQCNLAAPQPQSHSEDQDQQPQLDRHRVAQLHRRVNGGDEPWHILADHDAAGEKRVRHRAYPRMHHHFGHDQHRQGDQQATVCLDVAQEWQRRSRDQVPADKRQPQQRKPRKSRDDEDSTLQELESIAGEARPAEQLKDRPAKDQ